MKLLHKHWYTGEDVYIKKHHSKKIFEVDVDCLGKANMVRCLTRLTGDKIVRVKPHRRYYKWVI